MNAPDAAPDDELELVDEYLETHFGPIAKRVASKFNDPKMRRLALRRSTRHIFHWARDRSLLDALEDGVYPNVEAALEADEAGGWDEPSSMVEAADRMTGDVSGNGRGVPAEERPPEDWRTGDEPATDKQKLVLEDRGVVFSPDISKAEASRLISEVTYGGD